MQATNLFTQVFFCPELPFAVCLRRLLLASCLFVVCLFVNRTFRFFPHFALSTVCCIRFFFCKLPLHIFGCLCSVSCHPLSLCSPFPRQSCFLLGVLGCLDRTFGGLLDTSGDHFASIHNLLASFTSLLC